jgi:hypothetical protein
MEAKFNVFLFLKFCARLVSKFGKSAKMSDNCFAKAQNEYEKYRI